MTTQELVELGTEIVNQARERGAVIRLFGGVAIYARCPSIATHPRLSRAYRDLDFIAPVSAWKVLPDLFIARGFRMKVNSPARATFTRAELTVDVRGAHYQDYFTLDWAGRLEADSLTVPLADLLLVKLQRVRMAEKDIQDALGLLLDHRVASGGDEETIDRDYLYGLTNSSWGLWTAVFDNTVLLEKILDRYVEPEEAQLVWRRIELIQEVLDGKAKSLRWWMRSIPSKRIKWYQEPIMQTEPDSVQVRV